MTVLLILFAVGVFLEFALHLPGPFWRLRVVFAVVGMVAIGLASGALLASWINVASIVLLVLGSFRVFNLVRIVKARMHERYLQRVTLRTSLVLLGLQAIVVDVWAAWDMWYKNGLLTWSVVAGLQLLGAIILMWSTSRSLQKTTWPRHIQPRSDSELPTVTIAIPARNETEDLQACLHSLIGNNYPKLEILVLDDCSQMARTPEIIRSFAHDGVRFVKGEAPKDIWLPKNQAYAHLAREASGDYILFCGVDVRFGPESVRQLVNVLLDKKKRMMSVLPRRSPEAQARFAIVQAMRYWWELVPPRRLFNRPPVLSSCWIIEADTLKKIGGFAATRRAIVPEAHLAQAVSKDGDGYSFMRSDGVGIESGKSASDQRDTAIRTRYPQLHRRPETALLVSSAELFFLVAPFVMAVGGFWLPIGGLAQGMAALACLFLVISYVRMVRSTRINSVQFGLIALPVVVVYDIGMIFYSMWQYEFSVVDWKGRNICIPAMHVVPHLPRLK